MNKQINMKDQSNKKSIWALCLSIIAIVLCLVVFALRIFEIMPHSVIKPESIIGACVALLGVIVTMAVGWQIYNAIEMKEKIAEIDRLQQKQDGQEHRMEQMYYNTSRVVGYAMAAIAENRHDNANARRWLLSSFKFSLLQDVPQDINDMLLDMQDFVKAMPDNASISKSGLTEIVDHDKEIRNNPLYKIFANKYEPILEELQRKSR